MEGFRRLIVIAFLAACSRADVPVDIAENSRRPSATRATQARAVMLVAPMFSQHFTPGDDVVVVAKVSPENEVQRVEFIANGKPIGSTNRLPFRMRFQPDREGHYTLTARASFASGHSLESPPVKISVLVPPAESEISDATSFILGLGSQTIAVGIVQPVPNSVFSRPREIRIVAEAASHEGRIVRTEFVVDKRVVFVRHDRPYEYTWVNPPFGRHTLSVRAIDEAGNRAESREIDLVVHAQ